MEYNIEQIGARVQTVRKSEGLSRDDFGKALGVSRDVVLNIEYGRLKRLPEATLRLICKTYDVNYGWLMNGTGQMHPPKVEEDLTIQIAKLLEGENETAKKVFQAFASFDEEDWKTVKKFIDNLKSI